MEIMHNDLKLKYQRSEMLSSVKKEKREESKQCTSMIENTEKGSREMQVPHQRKAFSRIRARPYSDEDALSAPSRDKNRRKIRYETCPVFSNLMFAEMFPGERCIFISNEINTVYTRAFAKIGF